MVENYILWLGAQKENMMWQSLEKEKKKLQILVPDISSFSSSKNVGESG